MVIFEAIFQFVILVSLAICGSILLDCGMRALSERRCRMRLKADIESYLNPGKRI